MGSDRVENVPAHEAEARGLREGVERPVRVGPWEVRLFWAVGATGGPTELSVKAAPDAAPADVSQGINTSTLRAIPIAKITEDMRKVLALTDALKTHATRFEAITHISAEVKIQPNPGSKGRPDVFYASVAMAYELLSKESNHPIKALAKATGSTLSAASNWVHQCREMGMLSDAQPGKVGGIATDRARRLFGPPEL